MNKKDEKQTWKVKESGGASWAGCSLRLQQDWERIGAPRLFVPEKKIGTLLGCWAEADVRSKPPVAYGETNTTSIFFAGNDPNWRCEIVKWSEKRCGTWSGRDWMPCIREYNTGIGVYRVCWWLGDRCLEERCSALSYLFWVVACGWDGSESNQTGRATCDNVRYCYWNELKPFRLLAHVFETKVLVTMLWVKSLIRYTWLECCTSCTVHQAKTTPCIKSRQPFHFGTREKAATICLYPAAGWQMCAK